MHGGIKMKKLVIALCALTTLAGCWHEYYEDQRIIKQDGSVVTVSIYWNKATKCYEMKIGRFYYPVAIGTPDEDIVDVPTLRSGSNDSVIVDMWKHTTFSEDSTHNHYVRTLPVIDGRIDVSSFIDYASCRANSVTMYNYREYDEGFSFQTRDEFPDDSNALTIFNEITIVPKY